MNVRRVGIFVFLILVVTGVVAWRVLQQTGRQTISLPDGSQLKLLKVTHGTNHTCRYDNRWQDLLSPVLPQKLRAKFPPRMMNFTSGNGDTVMVWLRHDGGQTVGGWPPPFFLAVADENQLESRLFHNANATRTLNPRNPPATVPGGAAPTKVQLVGGPTKISGWELKSFPRRAAQFKIRVYRQEPNGRVMHIGDFEVRNPRPGKFATWSAETSPASRGTNDLEVTLTELETGLTGKETGQGPAGEGSKSFSRATFKLKVNGAPTEHWSLCGISSSNAAGEFRPGGSYSSRWERGEHKVDFEGGLWMEEPAWKINADFARTGDFPSDELWSIKGASVPQAGSLMETRIVTNIHNVELEFLGVSGAKAKLPEDYAGIEPHANLHVRTPHPMDGLRFVLVEVRDDQGRRLKTNGSTARSSMGGRGNTPKEMLHGFAIEILEDAKLLDITFAATRVVRAEFFAKPVLFDSNP